MLILVLAGPIHTDKEMLSLTSNLSLSVSSQALPDVWILIIPFFPIDSPAPSECLAESHCPQTLPHAILSCIHTKQPLPHALCYRPSLTSVNNAPRLLQNKPLKAYLLLCLCLTSTS